MKRIVRLTESDLTRIVRRVINEGRTIAETAKNLYDAKGGMFGNDKEAQVVSELMSIKDLTQLNAVSTELAKLNGGITIHPFLAGFMTGGDLTKAVHKGRSVEDELKRIYGVTDEYARLPESVSKFYNFNANIKDTVRRFGAGISRQDRTSGKEQ
jgi:hypothetical protein